MSAIIAAILLLVGLGSCAMAATPALVSVGAFLMLLALTVMGAAQQIVEELRKLAPPKIKNIVESPNAPSRHG
ncbi:MAG: hypothetical protein AB7P08_17300 [Burkholderiales bacterium]